uniref:NF-kappa-B-repressing factor n=1 Tax=Pectinophora gossypiella TaxID=13191 RepID=A0A1E1WJ10_PECGO
MSFDVNWDIDKYREEHESDDHWELRRRFMERWKSDYSEERLVCLARVFANMELLGCRYPVEVMQEVARLAHDVAQAYRSSRKDKLKRTFVSASDAAEDRAKGVKREGGVIVDGPTKKSAKIQFVRPGQSDNTNTSDNEEPVNDNDTSDNDNTKSLKDVEENNGREDVKTSDPNEYMKEMQNMNCLDVRCFNDRMFQTYFGRMVLLIRPWTNKLSNIQSSCQVCHIPLTNTYENGCFSLMLGGKLLASAQGASKAEAKSIVETLAWNRLKESVICVVVKEQWIAHGDARISVSDVTGRQEEFGTPVENSVALKMMKLMGWKGGGLGAEAQGIAEPIKPNLQMVNRAGLGSNADIRHLRRAAQALMQRYVASSSLDVDLVFSSEFSKEERSQLHQLAQRAGLASRSYGDKDRFLVVKKKLDPFSLVRAVVEQGGSTPKYEVFIPPALGRR